MVENTFTKKYIYVWQYKSLKAPYQETMTIVCIIIYYRFRNYYADNTMGTAAYSQSCTRPGFRFDEESGFGRCVSAGLGGVVMKYYGFFFPPSSPASVVTCTYIIIAISHDCVHPAIEVGPKTTTGTRSFGISVIHKTRTVTQNIVYYCVILM